MHVKRLAGVDEGCFHRAATLLRWDDAIQGRFAKAGAPVAVTA